MTCTHCDRPIDRNRERWEHVYGDSRDCWGQFCYAPGDNPLTDPARVAAPTEETTS